MAVARSVKKYLQERDVDYDVTVHAPQASASASAQAAHVPGDKVAKSVVLHDGEKYMLAVLPATHRIEIGALESIVDRRLGMATETELAGLFRDCEVGAVPALGAAYGMDVILDDSLSALPDIYFEAGDHCTLVHMSGDSFARLMKGSQQGRFSHHV